MRSRRRYAGALVLALAVGALSVGCTSAPVPDPAPVSSPGSPTAATTAGTPSPSAPALAAASARELAGDVTSGDGARVARAIALPSTSSVPDAVVRQLAGSHLEIDIASFERLDDGTATVSATLDGRPWRIYLVWVAGQWRIAGTEPRS